jgi:hypothetical protein
MNKKRYVSFEELYRSAPAHSTDRNDWKQWENEYEGEYVKGKGRVDSVSIHPQEGKLFLIVTVFGKEGTIGNGAKQVALLIEDAHTVAFGEEEGSFLIDDIKWIYLGDNYVFEGRVSGFSLFDTELVYLGYSDLIIITGKVKDIRRTEDEDEKRRSHGITRPYLTKAAWVQVN